MLKLFKKGFATVLSVCLVLMILPNAFAYTTASGTLENISWKLDSDGTLTITGTGDMPCRNKEEDYPWYAYYSSIRILRLEEGLTDVASYAFDYDYDRLETIYFSSTIKRLGVASFEGCDALQTVTIPGTVKSISLWTFASCKKLETVVLQEGLEEVYVASFESCPKLKSVVIPASVKQIWQRAFVDCTDLQDITILNKDCKLIDNEFDIDWSETIPVRTTIRGYSGSTAEAYAKRYGRTFAPITDNQLQTNDVLATLAKVLQQVLLQFMNFIRQFLAASAAQQTETQIQTTEPSANTAGDLSTILGSALAGFANLLTGMVTQVQNG